MDELIGWIRFSGVCSFGVAVWFTLSSLRASIDNKRVLASIDAVLGLCCATYSILAIYLVRSLHEYVRLHP